MYIILSWQPLNATTPPDIVEDLDHAMPASDFINTFDAFTGLRLANVVGGNLQRVNDLGQTLLTLSDERFRFVLGYAKDGFFMRSSSDVSQATCDAIATYRG